MHPIFTEPFHFPTQHGCLGMRLHPLTIGHLAILHEAESPFATLTRDVYRADLIYAVGICAQPYPAALREPSGWLEKLRLEWVTWKWGRVIRKLNLFDECAKFERYLKFHRRFPDAKPMNGKTRQLNSPEEWRLLGMLMQDFGLSWAEALNTPVLRAHALWASLGDREGFIDLHPSDSLSMARDKEFIEWAKEEDEKFFKQQGNNNN